MHTRRVPNETPRPPASAPTTPGRSRVLLGEPFHATETGPHAVGIRHQCGMVGWEVQATSDEEPGYYGFRLTAGQIAHAVTLDGNGEPVGIDGVWADDAGAGWALSLRSPEVNAHADLDGLLRRALDLQAPAPDKSRLARALSEGHLSPNDVRWVYAAAELVEAVVTQLEPGALRSPADLPDEPPLFTTRGLFQALEKRVERLEHAVTPTATRDDPYPGLSAAARVVAGLPERSASRDGSAGD